jgi:hypothetical protein
MDYGRFFNAEQSGGSLSRCSRLRENYICRVAQKNLRGEAREKSPSEGVLNQYVGARRLSATKHMSLFQQPAA